MMRLARPRPWLVTAIVGVAVLAMVTAVAMFAWPAARPAGRHVAHLAAPPGRVSLNGSTSPTPSCAPTTPGTGGPGSCGENQPSPVPSTGRPGATFAPPAGNGGTGSGGGSGTGGSGGSGGSGGGAPPPAPSPSPAGSITSLTVSPPSGLTCTDYDLTVVGSFTVTVTAVEPPHFNGTLVWSTYYSATSPTDMTASEGIGQTSFPSGTTTLTLTATFTKTSTVPLYGFCQGAGVQEPVPGFYIIHVGAEWATLAQGGMSATNYTQV